MKIMADLDAVNLGLDENEADIAEELQDFDDSFDTRSEASDSGSESSDSQPSISSVSTETSSIGTSNQVKKAKEKITKGEKVKDSKAKTATKRAASPVVVSKKVNGKNSASANATATKKKKSSMEKSLKNIAAGTSNTETHAEKTAKVNKSANKTKKSRKKLTESPNGSAEAVAAVEKSSGNKSDLSDFEDKPVQKSSSESESEDSDSAANIKRNGRKSIVSPEKKSSLTSNSGGVTAKNLNMGKSYDYMTKINYLFRDTRFFLIKSNNVDNIALSKSKNVWATLPQNDANLSQAYKEARNVLLIFSVNESGKFAGFARMSAPSRRDIPQVAWVLPPSISAKALGGVIEIDWICRKELSFTCTSHLYNSWNDGKPVKIGRDGQEIEPKMGAELCRLFPEDEKIELTPILRKSKETAKMMREKGIRVVYKPPRSLSVRGGSSGGRGGFHHGDRRDGGGGGPMRHKRSFGGGPHRPYKMPPHMGHPPGSFKRSSSPYRGSGPGGGSRAGGGDAGMPPWERYMTSAAAAEAYVADYMRTMHGQLPPLPFVPPFAQMPMPSAGPGGSVLPPPGPPTMYDQLPAPVRYYDGPPLPDYPPPQPIRPPPPGYDKAPSYDDFAAWKNAGMPPAPGLMPPGFPGFGGSGIPASNGGGSSGGVGGAGSLANSGNGMGGISSGPNSYRNRDNNANSNRTRERGGQRDYHHRGGGSVGGGVGPARGGERDRHFRAGGNERGNRNYRDGGRR